MTEGGHGEAEAEEHAFQRVLERMPSRDGIHFSESPLSFHHQDLIQNTFELRSVDTTALAEKSPSAGIQVKFWGNSQI